jgi:DNA-directed RNA polymerase specialized sigma54-like protein
MLLLPLLSACSNPLTLEIEESATAVVEAGTIVEDLLDQLGFDGFITMDLTESEELVNQGVGPDDIDSVRLVLLELEAVDPPGADLSFFESLSFLVEAPALDTELVASSQSLEAPIEALELEDLELKPYVVSESMSLVTEVSARRPAEDTTVEARFVLEVQATLTGVRNNL